MGMPTLYHVPEAVSTDAPGRNLPVTNYGRPYGGRVPPLRDKALRAGDDGLTSREAEVLQAIAKGLTNQEVAHGLSLSAYTVQSHRANIMRKLGLENRQQLMKYAVRKGYVSEEA